jgi:SAM-dependent methyltransferase
MEAQAMGAIPLTRPLWGLRDNVQHGIMLDGSPAADALMRARYVGELYRLVTQAGLQDRIRQPMMNWARAYHNWERWVDQWESAVLGMPPVVGQFTFQHKHAQGRILNIGCASDPSGFAQRGAVNLDVTRQDPITGQPFPAHVIADARETLPACIGEFDTVILGDILEHMTPDDQRRAIIEASRVLTQGGRLLITCPFDTRAPEIQQAGSQGTEEYAEGVSVFHADRVTREELRADCLSAGLTIEREEVLDYNFADGIGLIARRL